MYYATSDCDFQASVFKTLTKVLLGASAILLYSFIDTNQGSLEFYYGIIVTTLMFALIGAPLKDLVWQFTKII